MGLPALLEILIAMVSLATGIAGGMAWHSSRVRVQYANERELAHLRRVYEQLSSDVDLLWKQTDQRFDNLDRALDRIETQITLCSHLLKSSYPVKFLKEQAD